MSARKGSAGRPVVAAVSPVAPVLGGRSVSFGGDGAARGIAMGWVRQRARMARARSLAEGACWWGRDCLSRALTPEHALRLTSDIGYGGHAGWAARRLGRVDLINWDRDSPEQERAEVEALIQSPEWAALWEGC